MTLSIGRTIFPDMGSLVEHMNEARRIGDEVERARLNPMYERSHAHSDGWGTHAPLLASVVATARPGPVLEIGIGRCSSPLLVEMCKAMGRVLVGIDSDANWIEEVGDVNYPELVHMPDWSSLPQWFVSTMPWSVIFIDHGPGEARLPVLQMVHKVDVEFIVCHDTHNPDYLIGFDDYLNTFKYRYDYTKMPSCTSVVSDVRKYAGAR